jgi:hypothetical protein
MDEFKWIKVEDEIPAVGVDGRARVALSYRSKIVRKQDEFSLNWVFPGKELSGWYRSTNVTHWCWVPDRPGEQGELF